MKITIGITGLNGVLGKNFLFSTPKTFREKFLFIDLYHSKKNISSDDTLDVSHVKLDLSSTDVIIKTLKKVNPDIIIHLAAITHIDRCEKDKINGKNGQVWKINVKATEEIAKFCQQNQAHLIFLSTECVFSGKDKISYDEKSPHKPRNWYGHTKSEAEKTIKKLKYPWTIIRSVIAYNNNHNSPTIFSSIKKSFDSKKIFSVVNDQKFTPTYIPDIYSAIWKIISTKHTGIFHIAPKKILTPFEFAIVIGKHFGYDLNLVNGIKMKDYFSLDQSKLRLKNACLDCKYTTKTLKLKTKKIEDVLRNL